jgi:hypothetical protein
MFSLGQGQNEAQRGKALEQVKDAGLIREDQVRLCVICEWGFLDMEACQVAVPQCRLFRYNGANIAHVPYFRL